MLYKLLPEENVMIAKTKIQRGKWFLLYSLCGFIVLIFIGIFYFLFTIALMENRQFVNYHFPAQFSIEMSKDEGNYIRTLNPNTIEITDSLAYQNIKRDLEIYLCEAFYFKSYGVFNLFRHRIDRRDYVCLNINSTYHQSLLIQYNDGVMHSIGDSNSYWNIVKNGGGMQVRIFSRDTVPIVRMHFINLRK